MRGNGKAAGEGNGVGEEEEGSSELEGVGVTGSKETHSMLSTNTAGNAQVHRR